MTEGAWAFDESGHATLIAAPSSTKIKKRERDPSMHQTKKGNQCISA
jgi:hypothetical protein